MTTHAAERADPAGIDPAVVQRAAEWMARLWSGEACPADQAACAAWRAAHPDHERAWQRLQVLEHKLHGVPVAAARTALRTAVPGRNVKRRRAVQVLGLGLAAGGAAQWLHYSDAWPQATADERTGTGEVRLVTLPDGTRLVLASASAVDLRFTDRERVIVLRAGEVLVTTAHDPRPLRVQGRHGTVQALGTRFTVRQDRDSSRVAVFDGAVEIRPLQAHDRPVRLRAGEGARFSANGVDPIVPVQDSAAAWQRGLLVADGMRLDDFTAELARYRPGLLRCDPAVAGLRVTGVFSLRDTDRALHNLTLGLPVGVTYRTRYWVTVHTN